MTTGLILGCGYLGRVVAGRWLANGRRVLALTRSRADELQGLGIEPLLGDVLEPASLRLPPVDVVCWAIGYDRSRPYSKRDLYVRGLENVLTALPPPRRFIYVSSTSVYGQTDGSWVDETAATEPSEEGGRILVEAEGLLRAKRPDSLILRFAGIYGPGRLIRQEALERGQPARIDPEGWLNLIHVEDGAAAVLAAENAPPGRIVNVADGHPVRRRDFYSYRARLLHLPEPVFDPVPAGPNRRISNRRLIDEWGVRLRYPSYREGLLQALGRTGDGPDQPLSDRTGLP